MLLLGLVFAQMRRWHIVLWICKKISLVC